MTPESGNPNPETAFWCCPTARAHLTMSVLVSCGTGSILAQFFALVPRFPTMGAQMDEWIRIFCIASYVLALLVAFVGFLSIIVGGISHCGAIRLGSRRLHNSTVGFLFLGIFAFPWVTLIALSRWLR